MEPNQIMTRSALILADFWDFPARAMAQRREQWQDARAVDAGSPYVDLNNATLLHPLHPNRADDLVARLDSFYARGTGGGYTLWDAWQQVDLTPFGYKRTVEPCMVREPGGSAPPAPSRLEIVQVQDATSLSEFERALKAGFSLIGMPSHAIWDERVLALPDYRMWVGMVNDQPAATAMSFHAHGFVLVGFVSTVPEMRRSGLGEALTWRATLADPSMPALLHASPMGQPIYARMGYRVAGEAILWSRTHHR